MKLAKFARNPKAPRGAGRKESGIAAASRELGIPRTNARQAVKIAPELGWPKFQTALTAAPDRSHIIGVAAIDAPNSLGAVVR